MKKHTEKPPIDDLFARKLGSASLRPSPDGFERLQARMKPNQPEARIIFWQNPVAQRYVAVAACLLVVAGFGWLYWSSDNHSVSERTQVASSRTAVGPRSAGPHPSPKPEMKSESRTEMIAQAPNRVSSEPTLVNASAVAERKREVLTRRNRSASDVKTERLTLSVTLPDKRVAKIDKQPVKATPSSNGVTPSANEPTTNLPDRLVPANAAVANAPTRNPSVERILVVTIAEPEALVAARQTATVDQPVLIATDKPQKETKVNNLWQQVKRVKQGELFARRTDSDEENGLLSRAYNGLRHSFDKEKSAKQ